MWSDSISKVDMLAYEPYAELVYEIAVSERLNPLTVGLFGNWGSGKSTLLNLINEKIKLNNEKPKIVSVMVNAWMFEGYDDAKTALMDSILRVIDENETIPEECKKGIKGLFKKIDWIRVGSALAKQGIPLAVSAITSNPMPAILSSIDLIKSIDLTNDEEVEKIGGNISKLKGFLKDKEDNEKKSIVENIRTFRAEFIKFLGQSNIDNLVVMVDDLDRCSPDRILETLEAIKLFLSVEKTTFIIAMDEDVISYSIKSKYPPLSQGDEIDISKDYIEKIIQLPIKLPELSEIDIKNYILLLISEMFLKDEKLTYLINKLKEKEIFTKGEIISSTDILNILEINALNETEFFRTGLKYIDFKSQLGIFSLIGDIISYTLKGNPRQAKRFLNTFYVRKKLAIIQKINLDLAILAKLMVLEYTNINLFKLLYKWQFENQGIAKPLGEIEDIILNETKDISDTEYEYWGKPEIKRWILVDPINLSKVDLRQYFYLSRESVKEKGMSMLNIGLEERRKINEICESVDSTVKRRKIKELITYPSNKVKEIIEGIFSKYRQSQEKHHEEIIYIIEYFKEYRTKGIDELKKLDKLTPGNIQRIYSLKNIIPKEFKELEEYYLAEHKADKKLWYMIVK